MFKVLKIFLNKISSVQYNVITGIFSDRIPGRVILVTVIDNLVKGSSGQAIQNMNLMFGISEEMGLEQQPLFP